jgi:hypothetical protein
LELKKATIFLLFAVQNSRRESKMIKKNLKKIVLIAMLSTSIGFAGMTAGDANAENYSYQPGDFHQHSLYTDGGNTFAHQMSKNNQYALQWWANSEHGGKRNRDGNGVYWDTRKNVTILGDVEYSANHQEMWRWQSLRDYVYPEIVEARELYPDKTIISGVEWNVPGHEHCSTAIHQYDGTATAISEWEFRFDRSDDDNSRVGETGILGDEKTKTNGRVYPNGNNTCDYSKERAEAKLDAIAGVKWMQALYDSGLADAWVVPAHIERAHSYFIEDFRNWQDAGPDVAYGFEGAPGHQTSGDRGFGRSSLGGGTYGGTGFYCAMVGGLWDGLSAEGRKWFNFASSDDHRNWRQGGNDFYPGEYQKNYTYINKKAKDPIQAVFDGNRSGNSWNVMGDLIDELEFTVQSKKKKAMMGETLVVKKGKKVKIKIKVHDPNTPNNCPLDMENPSLAQVGISQPLNLPVLDHIDVIAGSITGNVPMTDLSDVENQSYVNTDYGTDAAVIETFVCNEDKKKCKKGKKKSKNGYITYVMHIKPENSMFIRLRGTNMPANVPFETDEAGNPLADSLANDNIYAIMDPVELEANLFEGEEIDTNSKLDDVAEAYADVWFYSNPIYIKVVE